MNKVQMLRNKITENQLMVETMKDGFAVLQNLGLTDAEMTREHETKLLSLISEIRKLENELEAL